MSLFPEDDITGLKRNGCNYHLITIFLCRFLFQGLFWISFFTLFKKNLWIYNSTDNEYWHSSFCSKCSFCLCWQ